MFLKFDCNFINKRAYGKYLHELNLVLARRDCAKSIAARPSESHSMAYNDISGRGLWKCLHGSIQSCTRNIPTQPPTLSESVVLSPTLPMTSSVGLAFGKILPIQNRVIQRIFLLNFKF